MPRAKPTDPIPDRSKTIQIVDMEHHGYTPFGLSETEQGEQCYLKTPLDFPAFLRLVRRVDVTKLGSKNTSADHLATTLEINLHDGRTIWIKYDRKKQRFTILTQAEDDEKPRVVEKF